MRRLFLATVCCLLALPSWPSYDFVVGGDDNNFACDLGAGNTLAYPVTVAIWIKYTGHPAERQYPVNFGNAVDSTNDSFLIRTDTTDGAFQATSTASAGGATSDSFTLADPASLDNTWFTLVAYFRSDTAREIYVNGSTDGANSGTRAVAEALRYLRIGESLVGAFPFDFNIAEVAIWNSDLSGANRALYEGGTSADQIDNANLIGYWTLDTENTTQADASGNGGPNCTAGGTPVFDTDHPTITHAEDSTAVLRRRRN